MKRLILLLIALVQVSVYAQNGNFSIKGKIGNFNAPAVAFIYYSILDNLYKDSCILKNGAFELKGSIQDQDPIEGKIVIFYSGRVKSYTAKVKSIETLSLYLEQGVTTVLSQDSLKNAVLSGSKVNDDSKMYKNLLKVVTDAKSQLSTTYKRGGNEKRASKEFMDPINKRNDELNLERKKILLKYIEDHPDSWMCFDALKTLGGSRPIASEMQPLFNSLSDKLKKSKTGTAYIDALLNTNNVKIGLPAPDFTLNDPNGKPVKLSDFKGKYVLLDFWASWCVPCRKENPNVVRIYNQYKDKNFTVLGVTLDKEVTKEAWLKAIRDDHLTWTHVMDMKSLKNTASVLYSIHAIPDNFLIAPDGKIIARTLRGEALSNKLAELLK